MTNAGQNSHLPSPVQLAIGTGVSVASVVDDEKVIGSCVIEKRSHLNSQLNTRVSNGGDLPLLGMEMVLSLQYLFQVHKVVLNGIILAPSQQEHRDIGVGGSLRLTLDEHGSILKVAGKGFEVMAFAEGGFLYGVVLRRLLEVRVSTKNDCTLGEMED